MWLCCCTDGINLVQMSNNKKKIRHSELKDRKRWSFLLWNAGSLTLCSEVLILHVKHPCSSICLNVSLKVMGPTWSGSYDFWFSARHLSSKSFCHLKTFLRQVLFTCMHQFPKAMWVKLISVAHNILESPQSSRTFHLKYQIWIVPNKTANRNHRIRSLM